MEVPSEGWGTGGVLIHSRSGVGANTSIRKYGQAGRVSVRLQMGPRRCQAYIMAYFQYQLNCNGSGTVLREVVACFKYGKVVMAYIQLTL